MSVQLSIPRQMRNNDISQKINEKKASNVRYKIITVEAIVNIVIES